MLLGSESPPQEENALQRATDNMQPCAAVESVLRSCRRLLGHLEWSQVGFGYSEWSQVGFGYSEWSQVGFGYSEWSQAIRRAKVSAMPLCGIYGACCRRR